MTKINPQLAEIIRKDAEELYFICFFEPYLINFIADLRSHNLGRTTLLESMSEEQFQDYVQRKNNEAIQEMCRQIKNDIPFPTAIQMAICVLLSDFICEE